MPTSLLSLTNLLMAIVILELGNGLQGLVVPIRAALEGFPLPVIGALGTAYYVGFVLGCMRVPWLIERFGHIRAFAALAAIAASAALVQALWVQEVLWLGLRLIIGFCFAGLFMAIESWLNFQATNDNRGRILGAYMVLTWVALIIGKMFLPLADPAGFVLFALVSIAITLSLVPVALTTGMVPTLSAPLRLEIRSLYRISPVGVVGCMAAGMANGSFWTLGPIFAQAHSSSNLVISLFMSVAVLGGALGQWPLGRWSDHTDRRRVIAAVGLIALTTAAALVVLAKADNHVLLFLILPFGAFALPIYALCIAHVNDQVSSQAFVEVSAQLLMLFGLGATVGPMVASALMAYLGPVGLFVFTATVHGGLMVFTVVRMWHRAPQVTEDWGAFVSVPMARTSQTVFELDPRAPPPDQAQETGSIGSATDQPSKP